LEVDPHLTTLLDFKRKIHWRATSGVKGGAKGCHGRHGDDLIIRVPPGTVVYDRDTGACLADLFREGERVLVARGGSGGRGNMHFTTATHKTPRYCENGEPGEERWLTLDLQMMAEVGIVGFPNAGKSTLLGCISRAEPKVGDYPFTTLQPVLGVVNRPGSFDGVVFADLPGLVEGAAEGVGLGHRFLRHVERTRVLLHLLDATSIESEQPLAKYDILRRELRLYSQALALRPEMLAVNKCEAVPEEVLSDLRRVCKKRGLSLWEISCHEHRGLDPLVAEVFRQLEGAPQPERRESHPLPARTHKEFRVEFEVDCWRVFGQQVEQLVRSTDQRDPDQLRNLQRKLLGWGVEDELMRCGAEAGDTVRIDKFLFDFEPTPEWLRREQLPNPDEVIVRPSQRGRIERRAQLRESAKQQARQAAKEAGTRGRGRKKGS
jgi:GTP-binding protein